MLPKLRLADALIGGIFLRFPTGPIVYSIRENGWRQRRLCWFLRDGMHRGISIRTLWAHTEPLTPSSFPILFLFFCNSSRVLIPLWTLFAGFSLHINVYKGPIYVQYISTRAYIRCSYFAFLFLTIQLLLTFANANTKGMHLTVFLNVGSQPSLCLRVFVRRCVKTSEIWKYLYEILIFIFVFIFFIKRFFLSLNS